MTFKVTILGSGSALPAAGKHHSAHVLNVHEQFYLVDCGEGTQSRLMRCGIPLLKLNAVFITHLHGDHLFGLFPMISTLGLLGRRTPLHLFGPGPLNEMLDFHRRHFDTQLPFEVKFHEADTRSYACLYENKVLEVWSVPLRHRIPCTGYLFREKVPPLNVRRDAVERYGLGIAQCVAAKRGEDVAVDTENGPLLLPNAEIAYRPYEPRSYAYLSDTLYSAKAASLVRGADLLYHEATFADADRALARQTGHSTTLQAAKAALAAGAERLLIGHFSARYKDDEAMASEARTLFPNTEAAVEGRTYAIAPRTNPLKC